MNKSFKLAILAVVATVFLSLTPTIISQAVVCPYSPSEQHAYTKCRNLYSGYSESAGTHQHLLGTTVDGKKHYIECRKTKYYQYCTYECVYCYATPSNMTYHTHSRITHSADSSYIEYID